MRFGRGTTSTEERCKSAFLFANSIQTDTVTSELSVILETSRNGLYYLCISRAAVGIQATCNLLHLRSF